MKEFIPDKNKKEYEYAVSACLCGIRCRYDGKEKCIPKIKQLYDEGKAVLICPEIMGGMPVPREPSEISCGRVLNAYGNDNTEFFERGAREALAVCKRYNIKKAILKQNSPSCGSKQVYDGTFSGKLRDGAGITTKLFRENGICVSDEKGEI